VTLADAAKEFGGRLRFETRLPGLATWGRVVDWRLAQLRERTNVSLYPGSELGADDILGLEHDHVVVATGARWTKMLFSTLEFPVGELDVPGVYTPDDLASGALPRDLSWCSISTITTWGAPSPSAWRSTPPTCTM